MGWWLRYRPGNEDVTGAVVWVSVQSTLVFWFNKNCTSRGSWGPSTSWDPWPRPVTHEAWGTQECTQIGGNGLSAPFWGIRVHCCDSRGLCERPWERRSVHKSAKMASRGCFGAFVYTVATREGHARVAPPLGWRLCRDSNPHKPPKEPPIETGQQVPGTHRRKVRSLSARRAPLVRREMRQAH